MCALVISKTKELLAQVDIPAVEVAQCPMDMEDFAKEGIKTRTVKPAHQNLQTKGEVVDIVTGITRGATCTRVKLNTLAKVLNSHLAEIIAREAEEAKKKKKKKATAAYLLDQLVVADALAELECGRGEAESITRHLSISATKAVGVASRSQ